MRFVVWALMFAACASTLDARRVALTDDALTIYRWPREADARRVLVVPEVGFDHRLVATLCQRLQRAGFDVYALDPNLTAGAGGFAVDVAVALRASKAGYLLATGVGGALAIRATRDVEVKGVLAVNVPFVFEPSNVALADALVAYGFDPSAWARTDAGPMLLGAGRSTSSASALRLETLALRPGEALRHDLASLYARRARLEPPGAALRVLVGVKDNLVEARLALDVRPLKSVVASRRMGLIEGFDQDVGHLEWLVDEVLLDDVFPALVDELEALP